MMNEDLQHTARRQRVRRVAGLLGAAAPLAAFAALGAAPLAGAEPATTVVTASDPCQVAVIPAGSLPFKHPECAGD
jgi:hypothetical protein